MGSGVADRQKNVVTGGTSNDGADGEGAAGGGDRDDEVLSGVDVADVDNRDERGVLDDLDKGGRGVSHANLDAGGVGVVGGDGGEAELGESDEVGRDAEERAAVDEREAGTGTDVGGDLATEGQVKLLGTEGTKGAVVGETEVAKLGVLGNGGEVGNVSVLGARVVGGGVVDVDGVEVDVDESGGDGLLAAGDDDVGGDSSSVGVLQGEVDVDVSERGAGKAARAHGEGANVGESTVAAGETESGAAAGREGDRNGAGESADRSRSRTGSVDGDVG